MATRPPELASRRLLPPTWESTRSKIKTFALGLPCSPKRPGRLACVDQRRKGDLGFRLPGRRRTCAASGDPDWLGDRRGRALGPSSWRVRSRTDVAPLLIGD